MNHRLPGFFPRRWLAVLTVMSLCLVAVLPLLRGTSPCTHDGGLHYFRVAAMRHALNQGALFTRWLPDLAFGYGFPFFNYRAPLSYYLTLGLHLTGLSLPWALNLVYVLSILGSAAGAYLLARDLFGPQAGVLAAVAYAYAPYQLLDALVRGNAPETVALALLPLVLWSFRRLALNGGRRWFLGSVALLTALYLGHNISSLLFTPFLLAYLAMLWHVYRGQRWKRVALAFFLPLGLTAFFWLPALAEKGYVQLYLTGATRNNDFHHNFLTLSEVLALPEAFDTSLMNPPLDVRLGIVQVVLATIGLVLGLVVLWGQRGHKDLSGLPERESGRDKCLESQRVREQRTSLFFFSGFAALFVFMSTPASVWFWEHVPLLPFVQFPWRFVGRANLPVALLAGAALLPLQKGAAADLGRDSRFGSCVLGLLPSLLVLAVVLAALPSTYPPRDYCPMKSYPTVQDVHRYERNSGLVGVDPVGAYFPVWVQERPQGSSLEAQYASEGAVARFDTDVLPERAEILEAEYGPNQARIVVESPEAFRARYLSFYFPGWGVWVDGEQVQVTPSDPEGLLTFMVPPGRHVVTVRFGETPLRLGADAVSALALLALVVSTLVRPISDGSTRRENVGSEHGRLRLLALLVTAALLPVLKLTVVDQMETPFRHPDLQDDGTLSGVAHPLSQPYADGLTLIGYDQGTEGRSGQMPSDEALRVDLYWTVRHQPSRRYQSVLHLVGPEGLRWSLSDSFRPTDHQGPPPTTTWQPGHYAVDSHEVEPLPGTPPGQYDVVLTVFEQDTLAPLSVLNEQGQAAAPQLTLGQVTLTAPRRPVDSERLGIRDRVDARLGPLTLLSADFDRAEAAPGDPVLTTTFWRAEEQPERDLALHLALLAAHGSSVAEYALPPVASWHPTATWRPGDVWRGQHLFHLPADLDTGVYTWTLSLSSSPSLSISLSQLSVTAPDRTFTQPPVSIETNARLGDIATLVGADVKPESLSLQPGTPLTVTLLWRADSETNTSYRVFLHLLDPSGNLVTQSDGIPGRWNRPTTGWVTGEYVDDPRTLTIPDGASAGEYTLRAGLYTSEAGRLSTPDGVDAVTVATVMVKR